MFSLNIPTFFIGQNRNSFAPNKNAHVELPGTPRGSSSFEKDRVVGDPFQMAMAYWWGSNKLLDPTGMIPLKQGKQP